MSVSQLHIRRNILATFLYFDVLDMPLTAMEVWKVCLDTKRLVGESNQAMQPGTVPFFSVLRVLDDMTKKKEIVFEKGMYALAQRENIIDIRRRSIKISDAKIREMKKWIAFFRYVPFIRGIIVTGGLSSKVATKKSDWDVLIVAKRGRIWTARTLMTLMTFLFGKRRYGRHVSDRVCLNHFITNTSLDMRMRDIYSAKEYIFAFPMTNEKLFLQFLKKNNWIRSFFPLWQQPGAQHTQCLSENSFGKKTQSFFEAMVGWNGIEAWLRSWQQQKIAKNPKTHLPGSYIFAQDDALIFLPHPHGPEVFERFRSKQRYIDKKS